MRTALFAALLATGCCFGGGGGSDDDVDWPTAEEVSVPTDDELFVYGYVSRTEGVTPPPRLTAPLPTTPEAFREWPDDAAPYNQVEARLRTDDPSMVALWLDAATTAARSAPAVDVAGAYASIVRYADGALAADLRRRASTTPTPGAHETILLALALQGAREDETLFTGEGALPSATLAWFAARPMHALTDTEASCLLTALGAHLTSYTPTRDVVSPCGEGVDDAVRALEDADRVEALIAIAAGLAGDQADCFDLELGAVADARAQARFASACVRIHDEVTCASHHAPEPLEPEEPATQPTPLEEVQTFGFDCHDVPSSGPRRDALIDALATCAQGDDYVADECLDDLAATDRARAVAVARAWLPAHPDTASLRESARALDAFPESADVTTYLRGNQLVADGDDVSALVSATSPLDALMTLGRASWFDTETDQYPNEHDTLLIQLAALAPSQMHGLLFDEIEPLEASDEGYEDEEDENGYVLHAFDRRTRYEAYAENLDDWYDVDAVVGLLNTIAYARHADVRWLTLETGDQTAIVVAGSESGLRALVQAGWLSPAGRGASEASRAAEQQIVDQLLGAESPP